MLGITAKGTSKNASLSTVDSFFSFCVFTNDLARLLCAYLEVLYISFTYTHTPISLLRRALSRLSV